MKEMPADRSYIKSIATLMSGSLVGQLFTLACSPVLTRICPAEDLGVYALVTGAITMFGAVMSLRYDVCIVTEPDEKKVYPLINLSLLLSVCLSLFITIGYIVYFHIFDSGTNFIVLGVLTGLLTLLMGVINVLTAYNNRQRAYELITKTYTMRVVFQNLLNLVAGFFGLGPAGLSASHLIGYCVGVRGQIAPLLLHKDDLSNVSKEDMLSAAISNKNQAILSTPATLANGLSYSLINYFINALYSTTVVGLYSLSYRILGLPITIISGNVSRVFLERASEEYRSKGNFRSTYLSTILMLVAMGIPIGLFLMLFAPRVCEFAFGEGWGVAGVYIRLLTPMFILRFIAGGVNCSAIIVDKQHIDLFIQILLTVSAVVVFALTSFFSLDIAAYLNVLNISFSLIYILYIYLFWQCARGEENW